MATDVAAATPRVPPLSVDHLSTMGAWFDVALKPLPASYVEGPDGAGISKHVHFRRAADGVGIERVTRVSQRVTTLVRRGAARPSRHAGWLRDGDVDRNAPVSAWAPFGAAARDPSNNVAVVDGRGDVTFVLPGDEATADGADAFAALNAITAGGRCRNCNGDHWTRMCTMDEALSSGVAKASPSDAVAEEARYVPRRAAEAAAAAAAATAASTVTLTQLPRTATSSSSLVDGRLPPPTDAAAVAARLTELRLQNLDEDTTEEEVRALAGRFGALERANVARDRDSGLCRGFAFVRFTRHEDAMRARTGLRGLAIGSLMLSTEWVPQADGAAFAAVSGMRGFGASRTGSYGDRLRPRGE